MYGQGILAPLGKASRSPGARRPLRSRHLQIPRGRDGGAAHLGAGARPSPHRRGWAFLLCAAGHIAPTSRVSSPASPRRAGRGTAPRRPAASASPMTPVAPSRWRVPPAASCRCSRRSPSCWAPWARWLVSWLAPPLATLLADLLAGLLVDLLVD